MPELPITVNANITRIDAPFPEQWKEDLFQFTKEISAIKELIATVASSLTKSTEAQNTLAKLYEKESLAQRASQAIAGEQSQQRPVDAQGTKPGQSTPPEALRYEAPPGTPGADRQVREAQEHGQKGPSQGASSPTKQYLEENPITMPQHFGGRYTTTDLLNLMAQGTNWASTTKVGSGEEQGLLGGLTRGLVGLSRDVVPRAQAATGLTKSYLTSAQNMSEGLNSYSGAMGYQPGSGIGTPFGLFGEGANNISGPFGTHFRLPLVNSGALNALNQTVNPFNSESAFSTALSTPGLSTDQTMAMNQSLAERGWQENGQLSKQGKELFGVQSKLIGKGGIFQALAENPEVQQLIDRGMRTGITSQKEMIKTIEEIPKAAENAKEGISQMVESMNQFGEFSQSQGGTHYAGQQQALMLAGSTGVPLQATKGLMESPWATSAIFRETGMPSWMQGTVPGGVKNAAIMNSFWSLAKSVGKGTGHTYRSGGFEKYVSPTEEQAARMHMLLPNMNPEAIQRLLREGKRGQEGRGEILEQAQMWKENAKQFMGTGRSGIEDQLLTATNVGKQNFGRLLHNMAQIKTAQGKNMFSREDLWKIRTNNGEGYEGLHGQDLVNAKYKALQEIVSTKAGKDSNAAGSPNKMVIELSPLAKKLLQLPNKQTRIKYEAGAGENSTVNGYTGSTDPILPNGDYNLRIK